MNDIGLVIWGCKGGHRIFCTNGVVDVKSPEIVNTVKDLRGFLRFVESRVTLYAIEFSDNYQVYTLYRSCRDAGNGAFVAFSVYVPHRRRLLGLRELMDGMADHYFAEYIHPMSNAYLPNKYDDITPYNRMLGELNLVDDTAKYNICSSKQDDNPILYLYKSLDEVDEFFSTPYRPEFFEHQEVLFMAQAVFDRVPSTLTFNTPNPAILRNVSQPTNKARLVWPAFLEKLGTSIEVNGRVCSPENPIYVDDEDSVEYCFQKDAYHSEIVSKGTVAALFEKKILNKHGDDFVFNESKFRFEAKDFSYSIMLKLDDGTQIHVPENVVTLIPNNDPYGSNRKVTGSQVTFKGTEIKKEWRYEIKPISSSNVVLQGDSIIVPEDLSTITIAVHKREYSLKTETPGQAVLLVGIGQETCRVAVRANKNEDLTVWLPDNIQPVAVQFSSEGNEVSVNDRQIIISPKTPDFVTYGMKLPKNEAAACEFLREWNILYEDKERREGDKVVLPYGANIGECRFVVSGKDEISLSVEEIPGFNQLVPLECVLTINKTGKKVLSLECNGVRFGELTPKQDAYKYTKSREDKYEIVVISPKQQQKSEDSSRESDNSTNEGANYRLRLINCKGYSIDGNNIDDDDKSLSVTTSKVKVNKSGELVCSIDLRSKMPILQSDKVRVTWEEETCIIALYRLECVGCSGLSLHVNGEEIGRIEKHEGSYELKKTSTFVEIKDGKKLVCSLSLKNPKEPITKKFRDCIAVTVNEYSCTITYRKEKNEGGNFFQSLFRKKGICFSLLGGLAIIALFVGGYFLYPILKNEKVVVWKMAFALDQESKIFGSSIKDFDLIDGGEFFGMKGDTLYLSLDRKARKNLPETKSEVEQVLQNMRVSISFAEGGSFEKKIIYGKDQISDAFASLETEEKENPVLCNVDISSPSYKDYKMLEGYSVKDSAFVDSCKSYCASYCEGKMIMKVENLLRNQIDSLNDEKVLEMCKEYFGNLSNTVDLRLASLRTERAQQELICSQQAKIKSFVNSLKSMECKKTVFDNAKKFFDELTSDQLRSYENFSGYITAYGEFFGLDSSQKDQLVRFMRQYHNSYLCDGQRRLLNNINANSESFNRYQRVLSKLVNGDYSFQVAEQVFNETKTR